jgi:hypothetical protein
MPNSGRLKRFLLFTAPTAHGRKQYVASFNSRNDAITGAEILKSDPAMRWQVVDTETSEVVAEDPGS